MIEGSCNCGAVSFEIDAVPTDVYVCHCSICRRLTGAAGIAVIVVPNTAFQWTSDAESVRHWHKPGHDWDAWFCETCGSTLPGPNDGTQMFVPAGLLSSGTERLAVAHHIHVDSRAPWDVIGDDGRQHGGSIGAQADSSSTAGAPDDA